jgi:hypothetical protein
MDLNKAEVAILEQSESTSEVQTLSDLQLALVGGGMGDTVL